MVHGAGAAQALLRAGLLDEMEIHLVPVLLGRGRRLFGGLGPKYPDPRSDMLRSSVFHRCQWVSTRPGATIIPRASISAAPGAASPGPTAAIWLPWMSKSPPARSPISGSMVNT
jgi:hypothetical protein